ncbi:hypothetical protein ACF3DV_05390 [Chlorogloeopsis fritschii PCC 9212]|uniref:hypothetical protein n=1 Tax=Chlorogloeopsis fritschii TaxID=1124 RepID=UPI00030433A6|nr:hypothetical protein [Chlorogloeopsis fritschii]
MGSKVRDTALLYPFLMLYPKLSRRSRTKIDDAQAISLIAKKIAIKQQVQDVN